MAEHIPAIDVDPFSDELLAEPYGYYRVLRDAGPVFSLPRYWLREVEPLADQVARELLDGAGHRRRAGT